MDFWLFDQYQTTGGSVQRLDKYWQYLRNAESNARDIYSHIGFEMLEEQGE